MACLLDGQGHPPLETVRKWAVELGESVGGSVGQNRELFPRRHLQGQEEVDLVVEMSGQPDTAKVLHHHGQQVLWAQRCERGRSGDYQGSQDPRTGGLG